MDTVHEETRHGLTIKIMQDPDPTTPEEDEDQNLFLVGYHRQFSVEGPRGPVPVWVGKGAKGALLVTKADAVALVSGKTAMEAQGYGWPRGLAKEYHVFALEAYIHGGVHLSLVSEGALLPDRNWDVSLLGAVFVARVEWKRRAAAYKAARGLVETWNDVMSGNVYGYSVEDKGVELESCWGFVGDYEKYALPEARAMADSYTNNGTTESNGQRLFPFAVKTEV